MYCPCLSICGAMYNLVCHSCYSKWSLLVKGYMILKDWAIQWPMKLNAARSKATKWEKSISSFIYAGMIFGLIITIQEREDSITLDLQ